MFETLLDVGVGVEIPFDVATQPLLAGTTALGWYGEVDRSRLITGVALATAVGLTAGTVMQPRVNSPWLHFGLNEKHLLVSKTPFRHSVSWSTLDGLGITTGTKTVVIGPHTYKVRLLKGAANGEWDKLMYKVSIDDPTATFWAKNIDGDLGLIAPIGAGGSTICQDLISATWPIRRGYSGSDTGAPITRSDSTDKSSVNALQCWRPCLELVS